MNIPEKQVAYKKRVGKVGTNPVYEVGLIGGFHLHVMMKSGVTEVLGTGPHKSVSKHISTKRYPNIVWTSLDKADHVEEIHFAHLLPRYEALTEKLRNIKG